MVHGVRSVAGAAATVVVSVALLAGGCSTNREVTEPEPVPVTEKRLTAALLTEDDLPGLLHGCRGRHRHQRRAHP